MMPSTEQGTLRTAGIIVLWLVTVLEALGMGLAGASKFVGSGWPSMFEGWGYAAWFAYVVGAAEMGGALLLLLPRLASYSATLLLVIMLGAMYTLATTTFETRLGLGVPALHTLVLIAILWARRGDRWRPGPASD